MFGNYLWTYYFLRTGNGAAELLRLHRVSFERRETSATGAAAAAAAATNSLLRSTAAPGSSGGTGTTTGASVTANTPTSAGAGSGKDTSSADGNNTVASTDSKAIDGAKPGGTRTSTSSSAAAVADAGYLLQYHYLHHPQHGVTNPFLANNMHFALEEELKVESMQEEVLQQQ